MSVKDNETVKLKEELKEKIPEKDRPIVARLFMTTRLITSFLEDCLPIPTNLVAYYNKASKEFHGYSEDILAFSNSVFENGLPLIEKTIEESVSRLFDDEKDEGQANGSEEE